MSGREFVPPYGKQYGLPSGSTHFSLLREKDQSPSFHQTLKSQLAKSTQMISSRNQCLSGCWIHRLIYIHIKKKRGPSRSTSNMSLFQIHLFKPMLQLQLLGLRKERNEFCVFVSASEEIDGRCVCSGRKEGMENPMRRRHFFQLHLEETNAAAG